MRYETVWKCCLKQPKDATQSFHKNEKRSIFITPIVSDTWLNLLSTDMHLMPSFLNGFWIHLKTFVQIIKVQNFPSDKTSVVLFS